ncbi:MAG: hypothetical protein JRD89_00830 [Deltaproteobacteria bacterium]|nr:hypothetical protein [Deltaproteobacteria bacterium]
MVSLLQDEIQVRSGEAVIYIEKHAPAGVWKKTWFSVCYECKGCWHGCGGSSPTDNEAKINEFVQRIKKQIENCKLWAAEGKKSGPKIRKIVDFRRIGRQTTLDSL